MNRHPLSVPRPQSLRELAEGVAIKSHFHDQLMNFLDEFYSDPKPDRLREEPPFLREKIGDGGLADAYLAAVAEYFASQYRWLIPAWALNPVRIAEPPHFAFKTPEGRIFLLTQSPAAFRSRQIFIGADALSRA